MANFTLFMQANVMPDGALVALTLDSDTAVPLFRQIYDGLRARIVTGDLSPGQRLPSSRKFSCELGVSRTTVVVAYDQLIAEGYAESRTGSGVYISALPEMAIAPYMPAATRPDTASPDKSRGRRNKEYRHPRPFRPGVPDMRLFPYQTWSRTVARVARSSPEDIVLGDGVLGDFRLRSAIAGHLATWRGVRVDPARIIVTSGAAGGLELIMRTLTRPGDEIALEDPGYVPVRRFAESLGLTVRWMPVGPDGAELPRAGPSGRVPTLTVLTPSHQFPLGGTMPMARRTAFLQTVHDHGTWLIEDDFDSEFRYSGTPIPALTGMEATMSFNDGPDAAQNRTIYVGSFSKIFSVALRLGFVVVPESLTSRFAETLEIFGSSVSIAPQRPLATFMDDGEFHRHIRRMRRIYRQRRTAFVSCIQSTLGHLVAFDAHPAGMQLAVRLADNVDDREVVRQAAVVGIDLVPLSIHYAGAKGPPGLLMGFSGYDEDEIAAPMDRVRRILEGF